VNKNKEVYKLVLGFFKGDEEKTDLWFRTSNPLLGGWIPEERIRAGNEEKILEWVKAQLAENEPAVQKKEFRCKHGHESHYDDMICVECARENAADFAYEEAARIIDEEVSRHPDFFASPKILRGLAEKIRGLKSMNVSSAMKFDALCPHCGGRGLSAHQISSELSICPHCGGTGKAEAAVEGRPEVTCSRCGGKGKLEARLAEGILYNHECIKCGNHIGGCIVGGTSPLKEVPESKVCPFCGGPTRYVAMGEI